MVIAIGIALALFCFAITAIPIIRSRNARHLVNPLEMIDELAGKRQLIYQEMATLKEGIQIGTIPETEFQALYHNLRRRAAENLFVQRRWEHQLRSLDDALEQQVMDLRKARQDQEEVIICPECEVTSPASQKDCAACGTPLPPLTGVTPSGGKER